MNICASSTFVWTNTDQPSNQSHLVIFELPTMPVLGISITTKLLVSQPRISTMYHKTAGFPTTRWPFWNAWIPPGWPSWFCRSKRLRSLALAGCPNRWWPVPWMVQTAYAPSPVYAHVWQALVTCANKSVCAQSWAGCVFFFPHPQACRCGCDLPSVHAHVRTKWIVCVDTGTQLHRKIHWDVPEVCDHEHVPSLLYWNVSHGSYHLLTALCRSYMFFWPLGCEHPCPASGVDTRESHRQLSSIGSCCCLHTAWTTVIIQMKSWYDYPLANRS